MERLINSVYLFQQGDMKVNHAIKINKNVFIPVKCCFFFLFFFLFFFIFSNCVTLLNAVCHIFSNASPRASVEY